MRAPESRAMRGRLIGQPDPIYFSPLHSISPLFGRLLYFNFLGSRHRSPWDVERLRQSEFRPFTKQLTASNLEDTEAGASIRDHATETVGLSILLFTLKAVWVLFCPRNPTRVIVWSRACGTPSVTKCLPNVLTPRNRVSVVFVSFLPAVRHARAVVKPSVP